MADIGHRAGSLGSVEIDKKAHTDIEHAGMGLIFVQKNSTKRIDVGAAAAWILLKSSHKLNELCVGKFTNPLAIVHRRISCTFPPQTLR